MAFKRDIPPERNELTSLIDIVFLLLIFFLISFSFSLTADVNESKVYSEIELPKTNTDLPVMRDDRLENLMLQIVPDTTGGVNTRKVLVLWPAYEDTASISRGQALLTALEDSTFASFPEFFLFLPDAEFARLPASQLIAQSIAQYVEDEKFYHGNTRPIVEVRAEKNTEFRIISFIMDQCSAYKDAIPQIIIRTVP